MFVDNGIVPCGNCNEERSANQNCLLARNGFKPYARCDHCDLKAAQCMGMQSTGLIFAISFLAALFLFIHDPYWIRLNIVLLVGLLFWLGYRITLNTDELAVSNAKNRSLGQQLSGYNQSLEMEVSKRTSQLQKMATEDTLTGLMNRHAFERKVVDLMRGIDHENVEHVLGYVDLDQFKVVNDTCGHVAGDELLRQLAVLFRNSMRQEDVTARLGGDEFGIIFMNASINEAEKLAQRLLQNIGGYRFHWDGKTFSVGASIGMVSIRKNCCSLATLLSRADTACYAAKDAGRNRIYVAKEDDQLVRTQHEQMQWVSRIEEVLEDNLFELFAQPIVRMPEASSVEHYEILLRMKNGEHGDVLPMAFIPAAERYGKMVDIDRWVIENLFSRYQEVEKRLRKKVRFNINISALSVNEEVMIGYLQECFDRYHVPYEAITFELTETAAIANFQSALTFIEHFRALGCRFALDDFGCGLSSFSYLQNFPVDYLKIDGSFVTDIDTNEVNRAMVDAINQIGHVMGIKTVCEFVENEAVLDVLREIGIDYAQGYHFGHPVPLGSL